MTIDIQAAGNKHPYIEREKIMLLFFTGNKSYFDFSRMPVMYFYNFFNHGCLDLKSEKDAMYGIAEVSQHGFTPKDDHDPGDHHHGKAEFKGITHAVVVGGI